MASTTTIRVDSETHARLTALGSEAGQTLIETVRDAAEALRRQRFASRVGQELAELQDDPVAWAAYLVDGDATSVGDGIDR